jgi:hypothetical protein
MYGKGEDFLIIDQTDREWILWLIYQGQVPSHQYGSASSTTRSYKLRTSATIPPHVLRVTNRTGRNGHVFSSSQHAIECASTSIEVHQLLPAYCTVSRISCVLHDVSAMKICFMSCNILAITNCLMCYTCIEDLIHACIRPAIANCLMRRTCILLLYLVSSLLLVACRSYTFFIMYCRAHEYSRFIIEL